MTARELKNLPLPEQPIAPEKRKYSKPKVEKTSKEALRQIVSAEEKRRINEALEKIYGPQVKAKVKEDLGTAGTPEAEPTSVAEKKQGLFQNLVHKTKDPFSFLSLENPWHVMFRKIGRAKIQEQGFESFEDVKIEDINISKIEKLAANYRWSYVMDWNPRGKIEGEVTVRGALFGQKPVTLKWEAIFYETSLQGYRFANDTKIRFKEKDFWTSAGDRAVLNSVNKVMIKYHLKNPGWVGDGIYWDVLQKLTTEVKFYAEDNYRYYDIYRNDQRSVKTKMDTEISQELDQLRKKEIIRGLQNRSFDEKVFYYGSGAYKFLEILKSPEYKLANLEFQLIRQHANDLAPYLESRVIHDLGAANAIKATPLLDEQLKKQEQVDYVPVDINPAFIIAAAGQINNPKVNISGKILDFTQPLEGKLGEQPKVFTLLGNTLGNGDQTWQKKLLQNLSQSMTAEDALLVGIHLKSDWQETLKLYQNPAGRKFVMTTIRNLGFPEDKIELEMVADEQNRQIKQIIHIKEDLTVYQGKVLIPFKKGEKITIFISQKYEVGELEQLAQGAGLIMDKIFMDSKKQFELAVLKKAQ